MKQVNFYKEIETEEIRTFCKDCKHEHNLCANNLTMVSKLEYIDKAGLYDICEGCLTQNWSLQFDEEEELFGSGINWDNY